MRGLRHLVARFFDVLWARPLDETERGEVDVWLPASVADMFWDQPVADQRHGHNAARSVIGAGRPDLAAAALLHDVGKRHSRLGVWGRVVATLAMALGAGKTGRFRSYRDHGRLGAEELARRGADPVIVAFARYHATGRRPTGIDTETWQILMAADAAPPRGQRKPRSSPRRR